MSDIALILIIVGVAIFIEGYFLFWKMTKNCSDKDIFYAGRESFSVIIFAAIIIMVGTLVGG